MLKDILKNKVIIEKLREIESKHFDKEEDAKLYAQVAYDMFKDDFYLFKAEVTKQNAIIIEGPHIGEWVNYFEIRFSWIGEM